MTSTIDKECPMTSKTFFPAWSFFTLVAMVFLNAAAHSADDLKLWYDKPAANWEQQALPIGNGRLGAMIFGCVPEEHIQFNEESLWIGDEQDTGAYQNFGDLYVKFDHGPVTNYRRELDICRRGTQRKLRERRREVSSRSLRQQAGRRDDLSLLRPTSRARSPAALP